MRKSIIGMSFLLLLSLFLQASIQTPPDEKLFREAKILIFDKEWEKAQEKLGTLLQEYPRSLFYSQAVFYKARCLEEQGGKEEEALKT
ncbi:tetratricopeptide repeat protein, partial [bacterium]|nr:tetratricopeptide repeat protein [bacterium]